MQAEYIIAGIIFAVIGVLEVIFPDIVFYIQDFLRTDDVRDPSSIQRLFIRISGVTLTIMGIGIIVASFFLDSF